MNDDTMVGRDQNLENALAIDDAGRAGIEVHESIDIESIELGSPGAGSIAGLGWEEVVPTLQRQRGPNLDDQDDLALEPEEGAHLEQIQRAIRQVADLEREELQLAADLAQLRDAAAARERLLEDELAVSRETVAALESELSEQVAQIASLTLECSGLRAQLRAQDGPTPVAGHVGAHTVRDEADTVARLKQRLEERGRAVAVAKAEAEELRQECLRLRGFLARRLAPGPGAGRDDTKGRRWNLGNLLGRSHEATAQAAAFAGEPGTEVSTVAIDRAPGPPPAQERTAAQASVLRDAQLDRRRQMLERTRARTKPERVQSPPILRRYLIALEPERDDVYELTRPRTYVGRGAEASLRLADATVSRLHGILSLEEGVAFVEDASSTNGVFVNGQRVQRAALKDGDTVSFGTARYQYRIGPPPRQAN